MIRSDLLDALENRDQLANAALYTKEPALHIPQQPQPKICPVCNGTKQVEGPVDTLLECDFCGGTGKHRAVR